MLLFGAAVILGHLSIYIPHLSVSIGFRSIPVLLTGFLFGPFAGASNGAAVDLITFQWGGPHPYSFIFLLQSMSIGFIGGLGQTMMSLTRRTLGRLLASIVIASTALYGYLFPSGILALCAYAIVFWTLWAWSKGRGNKLAESLLVVFGLLIYLSSFGIGVVGSMLAAGPNSPLLFFKVRAAKELVKLFVFLPACYMYLNNRYEVA